MSSLQDAWDTATAPATFDPGTKIPAGDHTVTLAKSEVMHTSNGKRMWLLEFKDLHDRTVDKWHDLERVESVPYVKADALAFTYPGGGPDGLDEWAPTIVGTTCRIRVKWKAGESRDFATVYVNEVLELAKAETKPAASTPDEYDDLPF